MKTLEEKLAVMQAAAEGKEIECTIPEFKGWRDCYTPIWNWMDCDYRVKPEPEPKRYRPYTFEEVKGLIGMVVELKNGSLIGIITAIEMDCKEDNFFTVYISESWVTCKELLEKFTHIDGSPCGVEEGGDL